MWNRPADRRSVGSIAERSRRWRRSLPEHAKLRPRASCSAVWIPRDLGGVRFLPFERAFDGIVSTAAFHWVLDHDQLFASLRRALIPGGWLEVQCGGGPNLVALRDRADGLAARPKFARFFDGFREPWLFQEAEPAAAALRRAGFVDVETSIEPAPTVLDNAEQYREFVRNIIFRQHLERLPSEDLRAEFMNTLTEKAAADDPAFSLDYWRLNLRGRTN